MPHHVVFVQQTIDIPYQDYWTWFETYLCLCLGCPPCFFFQARELLCILMMKWLPSRMLSTDWGHSSKSRRTNRDNLLMRHGPILLWMILNQVIASLAESQSDSRREVSKVVRGISNNTVMPYGYIHSASTPRNIIDCASLAAGLNSCWLPAEWT